MLEVTVARKWSWGPWNSLRAWGGGVHRQKRWSPGATLRHWEYVCGGVGGREREWYQGVRGNLNGCVASSGEGEAPPTWGCLRAPTPYSKPGTYLMAFFSLRPRPESGVPTVSKEFL